MNDNLILNIREVLNYEGERTKIISEEMFLILHQIPALNKFINAKDPKLNSDIFKDLGNMWGIENITKEK